MNINGSIDAGRNRLSIAATFTAEPLEKTLQYWLKRLGIDWGVEFAPYNQVLQQLIDPAALLARNRGTKVILFRLEDLGGDLRRGANDFVAAVRSFTERTAGPVIVCGCPPSRSVVEDAARSTLQREVGDGLVSRLREISGVLPASAQELLDAYPVQDYDDPDAYAEMKLPYTDDCLAAIATFVMRRVHMAYRDPYKVIVLDCDNTLWDGVVGEDGTAGIQFPPWRRELQRFMLEQQTHGMLLCLCSKNNEKDVNDAIGVRDEMLIKREHIVASRVNWLPKSQNLQALAEELNLGLDSFIFVDDSPVECAEVAANCPYVALAQLPADPTEIPSFLRSFWAFDRRSETVEDAKRTLLYKQNAEREQFRRNTASFADFLAALDLNVIFANIDEANLARVAQLTQRTNQFNFTTHRRTEAEIDGFLKAAAGNSGFVVSVTDRFGDYGIVGAALLHPHETSLTVDTFLLSCRALGRGVEHRILRQIATIAHEQGLAAIELMYRPSKKNRPALDFLESLGTAPEKRAGDVTRFRISPEAATAVIYSAPTPAPAEAGGEERPKARASGEDARRINPALWAEIASHLSKPRQIVAAVEASSHAGAGDCHGGSDGGSDGAARSRRVPRRLDAVLEVVRKEVASLLGVGSPGEVDPRSGFFRLGMDSLEVPVLARRLAMQLGVQVPVPTIFKHPTIEALTRYIASELGLTDVEYTVMKVESAVTPAAATPLAAEPIAVVGIGCRFPGCSAGVESFWDLLNESRDAIRPIPAHRWDIDAFYDPDPAAKGRHMFAPQHYWTRPTTSIQSFLVFLLARLRISTHSSACFWRRASRRSSMLG